jgi:hypothetical protein
VQPVRSLNNRIAGKLAAWLCSMWLFWLLTILIWATVFFQRPEGAQGWILFLVSVFFQGVALPVLGFVSNQQGERTERVLQETHDKVLSEFAELKEMHEAQAYEMAAIKAMHRELHELVREVRHGERSGA